MKKPIFNAEKTRFLNDSTRPYDTIHAQYRYIYIYVQVAINSSNYFDKFTTPLSTNRDYLFGRTRPIEMSVNVTGYIGGRTVPIHGAIIFPSINSI